jgi:hypothetical protein
MTLRESLDPFAATLGTRRGTNESLVQFRRRDRTLPYEQIIKALPGGSTEVLQVALEHLYCLDFSQEERKTLLDNTVRRCLYMRKTPAEREYPMWRMAATLGVAVSNIDQRKLIERFINWPHNLPLEADKALELADGVWEHSIVEELTAGLLRQPEYWWKKNMPASELSMLKKTYGQGRIRKSFENILTPRGLEGPLQAWHREQPPSHDAMPVNHLMQSFELSAQGKSTYQYPSFMC